MHFSVKKYNNILVDKITVIFLLEWNVRRLIPVVDERMIIHVQSG